MNPTVTIKSIKNKHLLTDKAYNYILENIDKPLQLAAVWFNSKGKLAYLTVHFGDTVITFFDNNVIEGEFSNGIKFRLG